MSVVLDKAFFTRKMFTRAVLSSPLAAIGLALASMGDTILVGHGIGMDGLAAEGFISPLFLVASFFVFGLSVGGAIVYSNLMSEGKKDEAIGIFNSFLQASAVIGFAIAGLGLLFQDQLLLFLGADPEDAAVYGMAKSYMFYILLGIPFEILMEVLAAYLRNDDADALSVWIQTASGVGNLIISALLLLVFDWGIAGCSFGFFISNALATLTALAFILFRSGGELKLQWETAPLADAVKPLRLGFATSSEYIFDALFTLAAIHLLMELDGTDGVAVFNIIESLSLLFIFIYELIGKTSQPLFSVFFMECNYRELHRVFRYALYYSLFWGALFMALLIFYPQILDLLFGLEDVGDPSRAYYAARVFSVGALFMGASLLLQNYLQSEEDEAATFFVVFMRRLGTGLPLLLLLAQFGYHAFWWVYPLTEIVTLLGLFFYKKIKGEYKMVPPERVYAASFLGAVENTAEQMDKIDDFAVGYGADLKKRHTLRMVVEEICGLMDERARRQEEMPILTQLTLIAEEDGNFKLHMRDDGMDQNPFGLSQERLKTEPVSIDQVDFRGLGLMVVKKHVNRFFYRKYHGFNIVTVVV